MRKKLFTLLLAVAASIGTMFAEKVQIGNLYYNLDATNQTAEVSTSLTRIINVDDNSIDEWNMLPAQYVAQATCPEDAALLGLKSVKVFADPLYINILVEPNMDDITDLEWIPFHVYFDADNSDATGGYGDEFLDANTDFMLEGGIFADGEPYSYNPAIFKWWGEVGGDGWNWTDPSVEHDGSDFWGAIIGEGQLPVGNSQYVDGKFEIQLLRELLGTVHEMNDSEFGIGFDIQQNWSSVGILPCASATDENPSGKAVKLQVTINNNPYAEISGDIVIPETVNYDGVTYSVTSIERAFQGCSGLTSVTIPNSVTSIGGSAFQGCSGLTSIEIPNSVTSIERYAFQGCSGLTSVTIPNSVTSIGESAFQGCSGLTSITIPNSVTSIGENAFQNCSGLTSVTLNSNAIVSQAYSNNNSLKDIFGVQVPKYFIGDGVTSIGANAFYGCSGLTSVTIPNSVTSIGSSAFSGCSGLNSIEIPNSVTSIGQYAFSGCSGLNSIEIPNSVTGIGQYAFEDCSSLTSVTIPNSVTSIEGSAFSGCSGLNSIEIPNSVTSIGQYAFEDCSGLTSVTIPNSVTSIGAAAFFDCSNLKNVIIGSSVKVLEESAFAYCSSIESFTCYSQRPPTVNQYALYGLNYSTIVYVPADYLNNYIMHDAWGLYDVRPLGAKSTETTDVNVTPAENTAEVAWPAVSGAATYELVIKDKSGNVICTLIFNANGQLTSIAFAPSRNDAPQQTQAAGFSFTVIGLEEGTSYDLTMTSKDNNGGTLDTKTVSFTTTGESVPTNIDEVQSDQVQNTKILHNGQIFILRGDKTYTITGAEVK